MIEPHEHLCSAFVSHLVRLYVSEKTNIFVYIDKLVSLVPLDGETLNSLFEIFADWDGQLRYSDFPDMTFDDEGSQP